MFKPDYKRLHTNQRLFIQELEKRGAVVEVYDYDMEILRVSHHGKETWIVDRSTDRVSFTSTILTGDKQLTKDILNHNDLPIPQGQIFYLNKREEIKSYAIDTLGLPVVLKPHHSSHGNYVHSGIDDEVKLDFVLDLYKKNPRFPDPLIVEQHIHGDEYRIFITEKGDYAVLHREPSHVIGDGQTNIQMLAAYETERRKTLKAEKGTSLCAIVIDEETEDFLRRQRMTLLSIPASGQKVYLRSVSNLVKGGFSHDRTDVVHPSVIEIAKKALTCFEGLPLAGVDFITPDITCDQSLVRHAIVEMNASPGFSMHMLPGSGKPRNVAAMAADVLFPDL